MGFNMNILNFSLYCYYFLFIHQIIMIKASSALLIMENVKNYQPVKMCCSESEIFDKYRKRCITLGTSKDHVAEKNDSLYPYFGNWKHEKYPQLIHINPICGFDNYQVIDSKKKVSLRNNAIELSEQRNKSLSFEYISDSLQHILTS